MVKVEWDAADGVFIVDDEWILEVSDLRRLVKWLMRFYTGPSRVVGVEEVGDGLRLKVAAIRDGVFELIEADDDGVRTVFSQKVPEGPWEVIDGGERFVVLRSGGVLLKVVFGEFAEVIVGGSVYRVMPDVLEAAENVEELVELAAFVGDEVL